MGKSKRHKHVSKDSAAIPDVRRAAINELTLMDDIFMRKFFEKGDNTCIEYMLRVMLDKPDLHIERIETQKEITNLSGHGVRLDIYAVDSQGCHYNIEVQRDIRGASKRRVRYNSSVLDIDALDTGMNYEELPDTYVIFITSTDVLGEGRMLYHVERVIVDSGTIFDDGSHILYANTSCTDDPSPLGDLLHDFSCPDPALMRCTLFAERAQYLKGNERGVKDMEHELGWYERETEERILKKVTKQVTDQITADVTKQVTADVTKQVTADVTKQVTADLTKDHACRMLKMGLDHEAIAACVDLPREAVDILAAEMAV